MKRTNVVALATLLVVIGWGCAGPEKRALDQRTEGALARQHAARLRAAYTLMINALLPGMGHEKLVEREVPQQILEQICIHSGFSPGSTSGTEAGRYVARQPGAEAHRAALCEAIGAKLGPDTPKPARVWLLRQVERIGSDESVARLAELLEDQDPRIRESARRALQHNPAPKAGDVLRDALAREEGRAALHGRGGRGTSERSAWRVALINALAARRDDASVAILRRLARDGDLAVAAAAIAGLGDVGGAEARTALYSVWRDSGGRVRDQAAIALLRCADRLVHEGRKRPAARIFEDVYLSSTARPIRIAGLRGLTTIEREASLPRLFELMRGDDPRMRGMAAQFALDIPGGAVTGTIAEKLSEMPPAVQVLLLHGLAERRDAAARPAVLTALRSSEEAVRVAAAGALGQLGDSSDVMLLARIAADSNEAEREAAQDSLARLRGADVDALILKFMQGGEAKLRVELIRSLGARHCKAAVPALFEAAADADESVRVAALEVLGALARPDDLPQLLQCLTDERGEQARQATEDAVVAIGHRVIDPEQRAQPVLAMLPDVAGPAKAALIRVLGRLGGERALQAIRAARSADEAEVVDAAVRALANWPDTTVLDDLREIAKGSESQTHRVLALRGYVRLVRLPDVTVVRHGGLTLRNERRPLETLALLKTAMNLAERPEEKTLVLSGVADVIHLDALRTAEGYLDDEALRAEAAVTTLAIAKSLSAFHREESKAAVEKVVALVDLRPARGPDATDAGETVHRQATEAREFIERYTGYITAWKVSGPYLHEGAKAADLFDMVFPPEQAGTSVEWSELSATDAKNPWTFDLAGRFAGRDRCVYVKTMIGSDAVQPALLEIGSTDGVKAWLNGQVVHANNTTRELTVAEDKAYIVLRQGWNTLMLKITQGGAGWGFCCGVKSTEGGNLEGVVLRPARGPDATFVRHGGLTLQTVAPAGAGQPTAEQLQSITNAVPPGPAVRPQKPRSLLVFTFCEGFRHSSIECGAKALELTGEKTGAYITVVSEDVAVFAPERLRDFDAVCFLNSTGELFDDPKLKQSLLEFVKGGKGVVGIHAATDCFYKWSEFGEMMGAYFHGHPWHEEVTLKLDDPKHPINALFEGQPFVVTDEIYQFREPYSRQKLRVLLSLDTANTDMNKPGIHRDDGDFAVSWVRSYGKGRVFYCPLGHREEVFWNPTVLRHYLAGIQFALGDLPAETTPSAKTE